MRWHLRFALLVLTASCATSQAAKEASFTSPGIHWARVQQAESMGYSTERLENVRAAIHSLDTSAMMVVVGGLVLFEEGDSAEVSYIASIRKSVLSMLFGIEVAKGTIQLNTTLDELGIDDVGTLSSAEKEATIVDLLTSRSGVFHAASNPGDSSADMPERAVRSGMGISGGFLTMQKRALTECFEVRLRAWAPRASISL